MIPLHWLLAGTLALCGAAYGIGRAHGRDAAEARHAAAMEALEDQLDVAGERARSAAAQIEAYRQSQEELARRLEDEARSDGVDRTPAPDSVRRLRSRWGASAAP